MFAWRGAVAYSLVVLLGLLNVATLNRARALEKRVEQVETSHAATSRRLLAVVAGADALTHTASTGTNELSITSDQAVNVEDARFAG